MNLEDLKVYNRAMDLGEQIWNLVELWNHYQKDTIGKQLVKSADSVSARSIHGKPVPPQDTA